MTKDQTIARLTLGLKSIIKYALNQQAREMNTDNQEQMHLDRLIESDQKEEFGPSRVQRICRIGYNNACYVLERGIETGVLEKGSKDWTYRVARNA
jgi:hypothetical protein